MNTSRMSQGQIVAGAGGVLLIIGMFLDWESGLGDAFDVFSGMDIIMLIVAIVAIAWAASANMTTAVVPAGSGWIVGLLGVLVLGWALGVDLETPDAGIGAWIALVAAAAIAWGGLGTPRASAPSTPAPPPPSRPAV